MSENFDKELGVWLTEEETIDIPGYHVDLANRTAKQVHFPKKIEVQVMYTKPEAKHLSCNKNGHDWEIVDSKTYEIACKNCPIHKHLVPWRHKLVDGKVYERETGKFLF